MPTGYSADLAYIHDAGFGAFSENAAPGLLRLLGDHGIRSGRVVDLGCGSGLWARRLVEHGYEVLGIDISAAMIKLARRREPRATFKVGSFLRTALPRCAAITAIGECLGYLFDAQNSEAALEEFFARAHRALEPGGLLIFDLLVTLPGRTLRNAQRWRKGADWAVIVQVEEDVAGRLLTREITSFRRAGKAYRRTDEVHRVKLFDRHSVSQSLRRQGFSVKTLREYGELRFARGQVAFLARKR